MVVVEVVVVMVIETHSGGTGSVVLVCVVGGDSNLQWWEWV